MVLVVEDQITLSTRFGSSQIQLLLGDITHLPVEEKVDVIFTSAFPGDYSLVKGTLIHALHRNLDISVKALARDKELDLTRVYSCWMSKPLPAEKPYRRLVCFEVMHYQSASEQISMMFRAIMPIFNGNESTIITPPLATGCQGVPMEQMLGVMVNTACHWIKAGLPLKCLKLVLFARDVEMARASIHTTSIQLFSTLKNKWHAKETKLAFSRSFDITFSYHPNDKDSMAEIRKTIQGEDKSLAIHQDVFTMKADESWQDEVFDTMANSARIVIILTASFVADKWCGEQFSLAMCCNRLKGVEMVIPFYIETVDAFPSYMNLVQYQDCRSNSTETAAEKILMACKDLILAVYTYKARAESESKTTNEMEKKPVPVYDVFISYCHRTSDIANMALKILSSKYPQVKVFFDRSELKTGNLWQQALYEAVDKSRCLVAMLSDAYLASTVCQEEYNISLARLMSKDDFLLVPICMTELSTLPESFSAKKAVSISTREDMEKLIEKIMPTVLQLKGLPERKERETKKIEDILHHHRSLRFSKEYEFNRKTKMIERKNMLDGEEDYSQLEAKISFSYTSDGLKFAAVLTEMLKDSGANVTCNLLSFNQVEMRREIDDADVIVLFVSNDFLQSQHHIEELHIALCRQRQAKDRTVIYPVEVSPINEGFYYPSILPYRVSLSDHMWAHLGESFDFKVKRYQVLTSGMTGTYMCSPAEFVALQMMTKDILGLLSQRGKTTEIQTNLVNVVNVEKMNKNEEDKNVLPNKVAVSVSAYVTPKAHWDEDETDSESEVEENPDKNEAKEEETPAKKETREGETQEKKEAKEGETQEKKEAKEGETQEKKEAKEEESQEKKEAKEGESQEKKEAKEGETQEKKEAKEGETQEKKEAKEGETQEKKEAKEQDQESVESTVNTNLIAMALDEKRMMEELEKDGLMDAKKKQNPSKSKSRNSQSCIVL